MADGNAPKRIFLRKILYRMDFQLITEKMQEELFEYVAEKYNSYFSNQGSVQENAFDIDLNPIAPAMSKMNTRMQNVFVLMQPKSDSCDECNVKIGKTFVSLELDLNIISAKIPYYEWFSDMIAQIKPNPMFKPMRIGLRKFNLFYVLDENKQSLKDIFRIPYLPSADIGAYELNQTNTVEIYDIGDYSLNFSREYSTGNLSNAVINDKLAHLIAFDFDLYSAQQAVLDSFIQNPKKGLQDMNDNIYQFFTNIVKDDIVEQINKGDLLEQFNVIPF